MKKIATCGALVLGALLGLMAPAAHALTDTGCSDTESTSDKTKNLGYVGCIGPNDYTFALGSASTDELSDLNSGFPVGGVFRTWQRLGLSTDTGFGPFAANPNTSSGLLLLDMLRSDIFVIGLQALGVDILTGAPLQRVSYYEFDYSKLVGTNAIFFDTKGIDASKSPPLQVAALYTVVGAPPGGPGGGTGVPEPGSWALAVVALAALGATRLGSKSVRRGNR